ncbi:ADAMTS-like protein 3 [Eumeta japonica]|uniref:ADAMTS-like protein 3 n=1 Tax=Eumeta variegata TaxID=151549 RepID=A0A4C1VRU1_EUMVA|nr:ADAMTS-like protein 3 [Eumeta japonica]
MQSSVRFWLSYPRGKHTITRIAENTHNAAKLFNTETMMYALSVLNSPCKGSGNITLLEEDSWREQQCAAHDGAPYGGELFHWRAHRDDAEPCALTCRGTPQHLGQKPDPTISLSDEEERVVVVVLAARVSDGTRCRPGSLDMCIDGRCQGSYKSCFLQQSTEGKHTGSCFNAQVTPARPARAARPGPAHGLFKKSPSLVRPIVAPRAQTSPDTLLVFRELAELLFVFRVSDSVDSGHLRTRTGAKCPEAICSPAWTSRPRRPPLRYRSEPVLDIEDRMLSAYLPS